MVKSRTTVITMARFECLENPRFQGELIWWGSYGAPFNVGLFSDEFEVVYLP